MAARGATYSFKIKSATLPVTGTWDGSGIAPDVYVNVLVNGTVQKSTTQKKTFSPSWNESLAVSIPDPTATVQFCLWDYDSGLFDDPDQIDCLSFTGDDLSRLLRDGFSGTRTSTTTVTFAVDVDRTGDLP